MGLIETFAQNNEDIILSAFFADRNNGFYVDIGAYDPIVDSVTQYFYERGWNGINIEPNKDLHKSFVEQRVNDINLPIAVSNKKGTTLYREYKNELGLSTIDSATKDFYGSDNQISKKTSYKDIIVNTDTLKNIFDEHGISKINFMKIDVEGHEYEVLSGNDWVNYRPEVICIEANHILKDWHPILKNNSYVKVFFDGLNEYYIDNKNPNIQKKFNYVDFVIGKDTISHRHNKIIKDLENDLSKTRLSLDLTIQKNIKLSEYIGALEATINHNARLRSQIKGLLVAIDNVISVRINNLGRRRYNHVSFVYNKNSSASELLKIAHKVDTDTFESGADLRVYKILFFLLDRPYRITKQIMKKILKKMVKILKMVKVNK